MFEMYERLCAGLAERQVTLFLGAGVNAGVTRSDGKSFPLAPDLSEAICRDMLDDPELDLTLDEAAEQARFRVGEGEFNRYVLNLLTSFEPSRTHELIVSLPWDTIYTTNFDMLVEHAVERSNGPYGSIVPILSSNTDMTTLDENAIPYYKLHGSISEANSREGRLILSKEDYRTYQDLRVPLFRRLEQDVEGRTIVFLGYSLRDPNFRAVLEDCRTTIPGGELPLSYAIRPGFRDAEKAFWLSKYNIELVDVKATQFMKQLVETWFANGYEVLPVEQRKRYEYLSSDRSSSFPVVANSFHRIVPSRCGETADPHRFFRGAEPTWADINVEVAPPRTLFWEVLDAVLEDLADPTGRASVYLVDGHAGTGKTTLVWNLALVLARDFDVPVLLHIPGTPLLGKDLVPVIDSHGGKRLVVVVRDGAIHADSLIGLHIECLKNNLPVTIVVEERTNQWNSSANRANGSLRYDRYQLGPLDAKEIREILSALERHNCLGVLIDVDQDTRIQHFTAVADKELLVALRELTTGTRFDDIVVNEYEMIPSELGRMAYRYASAVGRIDLYIRYATLLRLLRCDHSTLSKLVFTDTEGVLLSGEAVGRTRHTIGYNLRVRHPIIASIVFDKSAPTDQDKYEVLNAIIAELDAGFPEDKALLTKLIQRRDLVKAFADIAYQRAIYDRLEEALPLSPYVLQHRSILEREIGDTEAAVGYARKAFSAQSHNPALKNTLALALERHARSLHDASERKKHLLEAEKLLKSELSSHPRSAYAYLGMAYVMRQKAELAEREEDRILQRTDSIALLDHAREFIDDPQVIEPEYARLLDELGERSDAIKHLKSVLKTAPNNTRVRTLCIRLMEQEGQAQEALTLAKKGLKFAPTDWRLFRSAARILHSQGASPELIRDYYEGAVRNNRSDVSLLVEYAGVRFAGGDIPRARELFSQANQIATTSSEKTKIRSWWSEAGDRRLFKGTVHRLSGAGAFVRASPEGFEAFFWRGRGINSGLRPGASVTFYVGFNALGARAEIFDASM